MAAVKPKRSRSSTACTTCRRMKVRCDVTLRFPNKCTRCDKSKVFCELDRQVSKPSTPPPPPPPPVLNLVPETTTTFGAPPTYEKSSIPQSISAAPIGGPLPPPSPLNRTTYGTTKGQVLADGTVIKATVIDQLFDLFMKHQYRYLPIFPKRYLTPSFLLHNSDDTFTTTHGPVRIPTMTSPVLFWTICAVACPMAFHNGIISQHVWDAITDHVRLLLQKHSMVTHYILRPFTALAHIYALVTLCEWPLPHRTTQEDLTWIYSGQAVHIGLLVGLHRSWFRSEFVIMDNDNTKYEQQQQQEQPTTDNDTTKYEQQQQQEQQPQTTRQEGSQSRARMHALMWMACFNINQRLASIHGVPATATLDYTLLARFNDDIKNKDEEGLSEFVKQVHIIHLLNRCINTLGIDTNASGMVDPNCRRLVHSSLEATLSQLGVDYSPMSAMTELVYLHTKVQLHSFLLAPDTLDRDRIWVVNPISIVCMQIIQRVQTMLSEDGQETPLFRTWPNFVPRIVLVASTILFQLSHSKYKAWLDQESVQAAVIRGRSVLSAMTWSATCPAARGVRVLDGFATMVTVDEIEDIPFSQSRLGAVYWGIMMTYKRWLIKQQKQQVQEQDALATANYISVPANSPVVTTMLSPAWSNQATTTVDDNLSISDLFGTNIHFDDHETMDNWNDLSWLDSYTPH